MKLTLGTDKTTPNALDLLRSPTAAAKAARIKELERQTQELLEQAKAKRTSAFEKFGETYFDRPAAFAYECLKWKKGETLTPYQDEIISAIPEKKRICVRGCHGLGKSCLASITILWFSLTREALGKDWKAVVTASVGTQLKQYLWPEVKKWCREIRWDKVGRATFNNRNELLTEALQLTYGRAFCVAPEEPAKLEGAHADHLLYVFDEAKAIPDAIFDAAEGAFSGAGSDTGRLAYALTMSTPGAPLGRFYDIQSDREKYPVWWPRWVTVQEVIAAKRVSLEDIEQKKRQWGEESSVFQQKVLGQFASADENSLIPLAWVEAAMLRGEADEQVRQATQAGAI